MLAVFVLIAGVLFATVIGAIACAALGTVQLMASLVPLAPCLVMVGTVLLTLTTLVLFLGGKEDRRAAAQDLSYLVPTLVVSAGLWYVAQYYLW